MKCLVTGGAGFIGSHIAEALVRKGAEVRVLDNLSMGRKENLASVWKKIDFMWGDIREPKDVRRAVRDIDYIFHQAALRSVPRSVDDPSASHDANATGTLTLLLAARQAKIKRLIYASSSSVYGDQRSFPQKEEMRTAPLSPYAVSKLAGEMYCTVFAKLFGVETVSLRYFNVFGPRQHPESQYAAVIPRFMQSALQGKSLEVHSDGKQSRDFTYIENVVQANLLASTAKGVAGLFFNVACGRSYSLLDIIGQLEKLTGRRLKRQFSGARSGDVRCTWAAIGKARKELHYRPTVNLEEGLRRTWEWFAAYRPTTRKPR